MKIRSSSISEFYETFSYTLQEKNLLYSVKKILNSVKKLEKNYYILLKNVNNFLFCKKLEKKTIEILML